MSELARAPMVHPIAPPTRACRACGSTDLSLVLDLGPLCVSGFPLPDEPDPPRVPLTLLCCAGCHLVQLGSSYPRDLLYRGDYWYQSGINEAMRHALREIVSDLEETVHWSGPGAVLDIGCNDGTLLFNWRRPALRLGCEPNATLAAKAARDLNLGWKGSPFQIFPNYFDPADYGSGSFDAVTAIAMAYDLEDPLAFFQGIAKVLAPLGVCVVQLTGLEEMLSAFAWDNLCHEHLEYYSFEAFESLVARAGLRISDVVKTDTNGGSTRYYLQHAAAPGDSFADGPRQQRATARVFAARVGADRAAPHLLADLAQFRADVATSIKRIQDAVRSRTAKGESVWAYGASTKGNTLLQACGFGPGDLTAAAERSPFKHGRVTAGSRIRITSEEEFHRAAPPAALVLPWHFLSGFIEREKKYLRSGAFIVPLPRVRVLGHRDVLVEIGA